MRGGAFILAASAFCVTVVNSGGSLFESVELSFGMGADILAWERFRDNRRPIYVSKFSKSSKNDSFVR